MFHRISTLVAKELQALLRDPRNRAILIAPVILQMALFPLAATLEVKNNTLAVLNQDGGRESHELIQRFSRAQAFTGLIVLESQADLRRTLDLQEALIGLQFPADFSRQLAAGESPTLQAVLDGRRSNSAQIALGYVQEILQAYLLERGRPALATGNSEIVVRHWFNPNLHYYWFIVPSLVAIITTISSMIVTALSVAREREQGTFDQLLVSPLTPGMIMVGKAIPAAMVSVVQATIILGAGIFIYGIPFQGSLLLLYGAMLFYILALVGFGLAISSICSTQQQALLGVFAFMMPAVLLSGYTSPIDNMPQWLQAITWVNPLRHFIVITKGVFLKDMSPAAVLANVWPLAVIALGTLGFANFVFRRKIG